MLVALPNLGDLPQPVAGSQDQAAHIESPGVEKVLQLGCLEGLTFSFSEGLKRKCKGNPSNMWIRGEARDVGKKLDE